MTGRRDPRQFDPTRAIRQVLSGLRDQHLRLRLAIGEAVAPRRQSAPALVPVTRAPVLVRRRRR